MDRCYGAAYNDTPRTSSSSDSDSSNTDGVDKRAAAASEEVAALCWSGASVGVARYLCAECRIEVFEAPVCVVAGEAVRRRGSGGGDGGGDGAVRIVVFEDVPPSLLWLVRYLEVHQPQVLLPHTGSEALSDVVSLVAAHAPLQAMLLSATTAFNAAEALPRLAAMYPAQSAELASRFHLEKRAMMRAMAALLQFVAAGQANVADVVERGVLHALYLEDTCAEALQITRTEQHPSSAQGRGRAKEGLSLRSLLSATQSSLGRAMLRQWIALPCCDAAEIDARQSVVAFFADVAHHPIASQLRAALHHVRSTAHIFTAMRCGRARRRHYASLHRTLRGVVRVQRLLCTVAHAVNRLYVLLQSIAVEPLEEMAAALARTVVGVATAVARGTEQNRVAVPFATAGPPPPPPLPPSQPAHCAAVHICDGVDAVLDELRLRLHELRLSLQSKAEAAFAQLPWEVRSHLSLRCVYVAAHGYLLCVPTAELVAVVRAYVPDAMPVTTGPAEAGTRREEEGEGCNSESENDSQAASSAEAEDVGSFPRRTEEEGAGSGAARLPASSAGGTAATDRPLTARECACCFMLDAFSWQFHHETQTGECCFKSAAMEELDTWVGDLQRRVQQREQQVRRDLDTALLYSSLHLLRPTRALGELDCLLGFARVSAQEGWCRPEVLVSEGDHATYQNADGEKDAADTSVDGVSGEEDGVLEIENGWHPLLSRQLGLQQLVPFSLRLRSSTDRVCVVLGVNGSGKSVLVNAVAHIVFLAHVGCHVPAASARVSLINGIFAPSSFCANVLTAPMRDAVSNFPFRDGDLERSGASAAVAAHTQAEATQSSFYGECVALHRVLHHVAGQQRAAAAAPPSDCASGRALVLLDEFGRGTAPEDGCALLKGTLRYFATEGEESAACGEGDASAAQKALSSLSHLKSRWRRAPLVLCTTHLVEMFDAPARALSVPAKTKELSSSHNNNSSGPHSTVAGETADHAPLITVLKDDLPLPLEWIKIYDMETLTTYASDDIAEDESAAAVHLCSNSNNNNNCCREGKSATVGGPATNTAGFARRRLPVDVTPTFHPVCVTPHTGEGRLEDWRRHAGAHLDAGPALGRQCGLDAELLACWESALRVLHNST